MLGNQKICRFAMQVSKWLLVGIVIGTSLYLVTETLWRLGFGFISVHKWGISTAGITVKTTILFGTLFLALVTGICELIQYRKRRRPNKSVSDERS